MRAAPIKRGHSLIKHGILQSNTGTLQSNTGTLQSNTNTKHRTLPSNTGIKHGHSPSNTCTLQSNTGTLRSNTGAWTTTRAPAGWKRRLPSAPATPRGPASSCPEAEGASTYTPTRTLGSAEATGGAGAGSSRAARERESSPLLTTRHPVTPCAPSFDRPTPCLNPAHTLRTPCPHPLQPNRHVSHASAVEDAMRMEAEGSDIIDVGAVSTQPGAANVSPEVELARAAPGLLVGLY